jgi:hypothetical protein
MTQWGKGATFFGANFISICSILSVLAVSPAVGQQPSPEQVGAIRSACRSDFMARCAGVTPGGADALACLRKNVAQLSSGCQAAVNAATPKPAAAIPAPAPPPASVAAAPQPAAAPAAVPALSGPAAVPSSDQVAAIRTACPSDFAAHCAGVPPGGLEGLSCLQRNAAKLSAACRFAVTTTGTAAPAQPVAAPPSPAPARPAAAPKPAVRSAAAPAAAAATTPATRPTAQQQAAIRSSCQSDFMSRCAGVQPGGADALACLKRNEAQLSGACRTAVAAIGGATTAAPAATPAGPTPAQQAAIKSACQRDFMMNCRGVQPGGQEAFMCLQRNSARLSAGCQGALAAVASGTTPAPVAAAAPAPARPPGLFPVRRAIRERLMGN